MSGFIKAYKSSLVVLIAPLILMPLLFMKESDVLDKDIFCKLFGDDSIPAFDTNSTGCQVDTEPVMFKCAFAVGVMVVFWCLEAAPLAVTSLIPLFMYPLLEVVPAKKICAFYFKDVIVLFLGGLTLAIAIEVWNLHKRIALWVLTKVGSKPVYLLGGFMATTSFLSMWMSNVATTAMMAPIAKAVLDQLKEAIEKTKDDNSSRNDELTKYDVGDDRSSLVTRSQVAEQIAIKDRMLLGLCKGLMLGIAYAASIGGVGMLTGTGPNLIGAQMVDERYNFSINFVNWASFATPLSVLMTIVTWGVLVVVFLRDEESHKIDMEVQAAETSKMIQMEYDNLGDVTFAEKMIVMCFNVLIILWLTRAPGGSGTGWSTLFPPGFASDATAAMFVCFMLFILPADRPFQKDEEGMYITARPLITWKQMASKMSWGVIFLLGGGFAMASGITSSGLGAFVGLNVQSLKGIPSYIMVLICVLTVNIVSQITSNSSTITIFASIICDIAENLGINPLYILVPSTAAASMAFTLPVSTPPNAVVFEYGYFSIIDMLKVGVPLSIIGSFLSSIMIFMFGHLEGTFHIFNPCPDYLMIDGKTTTFCEGYQSNISVTI